MTTQQLSYRLSPPTGPDHDRHKARSRSKIAQVRICIHNWGVSQTLLSSWGCRTKSSPCLVELVLNGLARLLVRGALGLGRVDSVQALGLDELVDDPAHARRQPLLRLPPGRQRTRQLRYNKKRKR